MSVLDVLNLPGRQIQLLKKGKKIDGRPPDTVKELLKRSPSKKNQKQVAKLKEHLAISTQENVVHATAGPNMKVIPESSRPRPSII